MTLPHLKTTVLASDPYCTVCIVSADHTGRLVLAECNGSDKLATAQEIVKRCNGYQEFRDLLERVLPLLDKAWGHDTDVFGALHSEAIDVDYAIRAALGEDLC